MKYRNTKQKQLILDTLDSSKNHPTIGELYKEVKSQDSSIGQATVYRNVNRLYREDKLMKISVHGIDHYDRKREKHFHLYCKKCRKLYDIFDDDYLLFASKVEKMQKIKVENMSILLEGVCEDCINEEV